MCAQCNALQETVTKLEADRLESIEENLRFEERVELLEQTLASFLQGAARAVDLSAMNIAAGLASMSEPTEASADNIFKSAA